MCLCEHVNNTREVPAFGFFLTTLFFDTGSHNESEAHCFCQTVRLAIKLQDMSVSDRQY